MDFNNILEVAKYFNDKQNCIDFLAYERWKGNPTCPFCSKDKPYQLKGKYKGYKCSHCCKQFSVTKGTIFEKSQIPLQKWFMAMYIMSSHKKGISSIQLGKDLGITQKTAWFMLHRIRKSFERNNGFLLEGIVEVDETYMSRKYGSKYQAIPPEESARMELIHKKNTKGAVIGMKQREGDIIVQAVENTKAKTIGDTVKANVSTEAKLMTDESLKYRKVLKGYDRQSINHSSGEWVRGKVHTNGIENFWSVMKRGIHGIYHQISYKHLQSYCDEYSFRFNTRKLNENTRFKVTLRQLNRRITYKQLTEK